MIFGPTNIESLLGGSLVRFKERKRSLSEEEREYKQANERRLNGGIDILRKMRTQALEEVDPALCQAALQEAHQLSEQMAEVILDQVIGEKPSPIDAGFLETLSKLKDEHLGKDAGSGHGLPPQFSINNLFRAADDMLVRIEEKTQSLEEPEHKLTQEELKYVLQEFLVGTNFLTIEAVNDFFEKDTKVGGILTGGSVYLELVKKIVERYADPSFNIDTFVIAVDKDKDKVLCETDGVDTDTQKVIITDDMIDRGGTMLTALWNTGQYFPKATIDCGKGIDRPGGFEQRRTEKHRDHLSVMFQDFADLSEEGRIDEALEIYKQAEQYAADNRVNLQLGWHKRKKRIDSGEFSDQ